jgi:hypothetical protein
MIRMLELCSRGLKLNNDVFTSSFFQMFTLRKSKTSSQVKKSTQKYLFSIVSTAKQK